MDICFECKIEKIKRILLCELCDDKLNIKIKKKMMEKWNWPFDRNDNSNQTIRFNN